jgi:hypothetical protein
MFLWLCPSNQQFSGLPGVCYCCTRPRPSAFVCVDRDVTDWQSEGARVPPNAHRDPGKHLQSGVTLVGAPHQFEVSKGPHGNNVVSGASARADSTHAWNDASELTFVLHRNHP